MQPQLSTLNPKPGKHLSPVVEDALREAIRGVEDAEGVGGTGVGGVQGKGDGMGEAETRYEACGAVDLS